MNRTRLSWIALLLAAGVFMACHADSVRLLPERVATHFDGAGRANGWMSRAQHVWFSPLIHLGASAFILGLTSILHRLPPVLLNLPNKDHWRDPAQYPAACAFLREWSRWLAAVMLVWAIFMDRQIVLANQTQPPRLDSAAIWMLTACFLAATSAAVLWLLLKFRREPPRTGPSATSPT